MKEYQQPEVEVIKLAIEEEISVDDPPQGLESGNPW